MMLNAELRQAAGSFVASVRGAAEYETYLQAHTAFQNDSELRGIRQRFGERTAALRPAQSTGTLTQEEINELKGLQRSLNGHPVTERYIHARQELLAILQECNQALSQELGFDFASAAAPRSCCG